MPLQTFYNLPEEKRTRLMEAIRQEFSRVSFDQVSINKIVQAAGIPRGSFYQYFKDKEDVLRYLLEGYKELLFRRIRESLREHNGDIFHLFVDLLDFTVEFVAQEPHNTFFQNLFRDFSINRDFYTSFAEGEHAPGGKRFFHGNDTREYQALLPYINTKNLDLRGPQDLPHILGVLKNLTGEAISRSFYDSAHTAQAREEFLARLSILARGFAKNKDELVLFHTN